MLLVRDIAKYHWLVDRSLRFQNLILGRLFKNGDIPASMPILIRYQTTNERAFQKSLAALVNLQKQRARAEIGSASQKAAEAVSPKAAAAPQTPNPTPIAQEITPESPGFVLAATPVAFQSAA